MDDNKNRICCEPRYGAARPIYVTPSEGERNARVEKQGRSGREEGGSRYIVDVKLYRCIAVKVDKSG